ncbi:hypothetical protein [Oceanobacillus senegalensis]|uniref:hypothetical protein n=1 Tax=Oceanobacillus senegalensis TaxID=1936063 RepID=UPI000A311F4E|nr:hypothetical protein [Oceanobacillus senegalensis]
MKLVLLIIVLILLLVIILFLQKDKEKIVESFSLGEFLQQKNIEAKDTTIITKVNDFFKSDHDSGHGDGMDNGGDIGDDGE